MEILEQIKNGTGSQVFGLMKKIEGLRKAGKNKPEYDIWWKACMDRAREINRTRFGNWQDAMAKLDLVLEPLVSFTDSKHIQMYLDPINGYPCVYSKTKNSKGIKSCVYITNPITNSMYLKRFGDVTAKEAEIFN